MNTSPVNDEEIKKSSGDNVNLFQKDEDEAEPEVKGFNYAGLAFFAEQCRKRKELNELEK